tara:strand:- start:59 stop:421 length:363 start_codon:yes stop_codon:yes gene_type:complete
MAFNELLADRISFFFKNEGVNFYEKKMFGGLCFMVNDKMCVGVVKDELMARIGEKNYNEALSKKGCSKMSFTGRPMKSYVFLNEEATDLDKNLEYWLKLALNFNPFAKASKKRANKKTPK